MRLISLVEVVLAACHPMLKISVRSDAWSMWGSSRVVLFSLRRGWVFRRRFQFFWGLVIPSGSLLLTVQELFNLKVSGFCMLVILFPSL